ncbi:MAG: carbon starvation protein A [Candidatus Omnitrophica bacterium]|nr:carbon starvation protein A [Candidatus Omnitrophota bacterium]
MSTVLFVTVLVLLALGYFVYGAYIKKLFRTGPDRPTPAVTRRDGVDYVPARNWVMLFGHHFASIAGAGPIVGPVLAYMYWGWAGIVVWLVFGSIFLGAVHDFCALFISMREDGSSIGQIAERYISRRASRVLLGFLWLALILVIAVFAAVCTKNFVREPDIVLPSAGLIPVAVVVGLLIYRLRLPVVFSTAVGLAGLGVLIFLGEKVPLVIPGTHAAQWWFLLLFGYAFIASIIPVDILLQPRDYISSFLLFAGIGVSCVGIFARPLPFPAGEAFRFHSPGGPFFPLMFITVACGAISGFHSLVASGTTSKQIASERDAPRIGYGAMILEGVLATIALICIAFGVRSAPSTADPIALFARGFSTIAFFLGDYAKFFALVILSAFILTTLDTATRITRFLTQELFKVRNKYASTALVVGCGYALCVSDTWQALWPMFGASNQLVAALALLVAAAYLIHHKQPSAAVLIPAGIMFFITFAALAVQTGKSFLQQQYLLTLLSMVLMVLGVFILWEFVQKRKQYAG